MPTVIMGGTASAWNEHSKVSLDEQKLVIIKAEMTEELKRKILEQDS